MPAKAYPLSCVNLLSAFSPHESSRSVSSGATAGHWGVSSGTPVRVRTGRESERNVRKRASSRSSGHKRRNA